MFALLKEIVKIFDPQFLRVIQLYTKSANFQGYISHTFIAYRHQILQFYNFNMFSPGFSLLAYTCKNLTACSKSAKNPLTSCALMDCSKDCQQVWNNLLTPVTNLLILLDLYKVIPASPIQS